MIRYNSIDALRTLAIFLMVICHAGIYLSSGEQEFGWYFLADNVLGDFAAAMFLFLVGVSQAVSLNKQNQQPNSLWKNFKYVFYRALIIFFLSFLLSFLCSGTPRIFEWNILSIIGFSLIVLFFLRRFSSNHLFITAFAIVLLAPYLRDTTLFLSHWGGDFEWNDFLISHNIKLLVEATGHYIPTFAIPNIVRGFIWMGWYPIFPWLAFPIIGLAVGKHFILPNLHQVLPNKLISLGSLFILIAFIIAAASPNDLDSANILKGYITPFCFYPNTTPMFSLQLGIAISVFGILAKYVDLPAPSQSRFLRYCNLISRYSLTIFVLHFLILFWPLRIAGYLQGDIHQYIANVVLPSTALLIGLGIMALLSLLVKLWDNYQGKYSLEWFLSRVRKN